MVFYVWYWIMQHCQIGSYSYTVDDNKYLRLQLCYQEEPINTFKLLFCSEISHSVQVSNRVNLHLMNVWSCLPIIYNMTFPAKANSTHELGHIDYIYGVLYFSNLKFTKGINQTILEALYSSMKRMIMLIRESTAISVCFVTFITCILWSMNFKSTLLNHS